MMTHDQHYKNLFNQPIAIQDLLTGFIEGDWIHDLDFASLEKVSGSYITDDIRNRESDVIWRVKFTNQQGHTSWVYVYILLEFQSTIDPFMAVRMMTYLGLLYQDLVKQNKLTVKDKLPPVLPIVLYNGERRWQSSTQITDLIEPVRDTHLQAYLPSLKYCLLDEGAIIADEYDNLELYNVVTAIFRLEKRPDLEEYYNVFQLLIDYLQAPQQEPMRKALVTWFNDKLEQTSWQDDLKRTADFKEPLTELSEVKNMLAKSMERVPDKWIQQGKLEVAKKLLLKGIDTQIIIETTGLTKKELNKLKR